MTTNLPNQLPLFTPGRASQLANTLPETRAAELRLRAIAAAAGITYDIADYGGLRTPVDTAQLTKWRDEAVTTARKNAEASARRINASAAQVKAAGDAAAAAANYRVSPADLSYHGVGGAFDIKIVSMPKGMALAEAYAYLGARAKECGLRWGGTFSAPKDVYHFELLAPRADVAVKWQQFAAKNRITNTGGGGAVVPVIIGALLIVGVALLAAHSPPEA